MQITLSLRECYVSRNFKHLSNRGRKILDTVDDEVEHLVNRSYERAKNILETNMQLLHHLAKTLIEREVVSAEEFNMMLIEFDAKTVSFDISIPEDQRDTVLKGTDYSI